MDVCDHRVLGARLELYHIQEDAPGMVFWHPRGAALYRVLENFIRRCMRRAGYDEIKTPQLLPLELWKRSGHWEKFGETMFALGEGERRMALKPMSCPGHLQIFNQGLKSWRDLPVRYAEFGACHRDEPSGALHGLMRSRAFEQDDAHVICRAEDVFDEVANFARVLSDIYAQTGFSEWRVALSTRPAVRAGSDGDWDWAEQCLGEAAVYAGLEYDVQPGEGAFYGPKLEFILRDVMGRSWQCGTIQLDMVLPGRLGASYIGPDGLPAVPLMIHHAIFGSMGRFIGIMLEQHRGVLPFWLAPDQVAVAPIARGQAEYGREVFEVLEDAGVRCVMMDGADTLSRRIVAAREREIPVMAILGAREQEEKIITLRERDGSQIVVPLGEVALMLATRKE